MADNLEQLWLRESPDAAIVTDMAGVVLDWNPGASSIFGYDLAESRGCRLHDLIVPPDQRDDAEQEWRDALQRGGGTSEAVRQPKDGTLRYVDITTKVVRAPETGANQPVVLVSIKDVTELRVLRDAQLVEAKFGRLLESTPDGIVLVNGTGRIVLANSNAERLFGYQHGELLGRAVECLMPRRYHGSHTGHRANYFAQPRTRAMGAGLELYGIRKDGGEFPVEISLCPLESEEGTLAMSAIRDISDRKRIEQALQEKNIELRNAAEAKNRFLASMSHELRTPLNGIIGFAEFLYDGKPGPLNPKQKEYLNDILNSGRHLLQLINDVLDLAKVEAGRMALTPERFSVTRAVDEVCAVARPLAEKKSIALRSVITPAVDDVELDQPKFKQVLYNLLSNAIKFTDSGGRVEVRAQPDGPGAFVLAVTDNGIGIKEEDLPRLFREFEQLESGAARHYEGSGLGLALTRRLVELQGGNVTVESAVGRGSTFAVTLPRR
jgi:PAS domain S-box-containing protein